MTRHEWVLSKIKPTDTVLHVGASGNDWELEMRWNDTVPLHTKIVDRAEKMVDERTNNAFSYQDYEVATE